MYRLYYVCCCYNGYIKLFAFAAPSAGVTDVQASVNSSTVITVSWLPPTVENWNGIITSYNISKLHSTTFHRLFGIGCIY